jgi:hypothetical protein
LLLTVTSSGTCAMATLTVRQNATELIHFDADFMLLEANFNE